MEMEFDDFFANSFQILHFILALYGILEYVVCY